MGGGGVIELGFELVALEVKIKGVLTGNTLVMVTTNCMKIVYR